MFISDVIYTLNTKSLEVYVKGCKPKMIDGKLQHCPGCHNNELWGFCITDNTEEEYKKIVDRIKKFDNMIDNIWILGGDPLDQNPVELKDFISKIRILGKKLVLFTGYDIEYYKETNLNLDVDYIKCGHYDEKGKEKVFNKTLNCELIGKNQKVYDSNLNEVK